MQLSLFELDPIPLKPEKPESTTLSFSQRRREIIEQRGGWWKVKLKDDHRIIEVGKQLWLTDGKMVGVTRVLEIFKPWYTASLEVVLLTGDEPIFGFGYSFWEDPETYLKTRLIIEVNSFELWSDKPRVLAKSHKKSHKNSESSGNWVKLSLWSWFQNQNWNQKDRDEMRIALESNDRLILNNTYWFAQKQIGELSQKVNRVIDMEEFDFWFWKLLKAVVETVGDLPEQPQSRPIQIVNQIKSRQQMSG